MMPIAALRPQAAALVFCVAAGAICAWLKTPIPWMIGPLFVMALARWRAVDVEAPNGFRNGGQWLMGTALGLYFTPEMLRLVAHLFPWMVASGLFAIFIAWVCARVLTRCANGFKVDATTAFFSCVPGGASEMANLSERYGGRQDLVAAAQSLRILIVVAVIPFAYAAAGIHGADAYLPGPKLVEWGGLAQLLALTLAAGLLAGRTGVPNSFVLGPLFATMLLTGAGVTWSALPPWLINGGQLMIGCALGARFDQEFFHSAPRFMLAAGVATLAALGLSSSFAVAMGSLAGIHWTTAILALAPGGMPEMSITAKVLQLGVPVVVAFHVTRMAILVTLSGPLFKWWSRRGA